MKDKVKAEYEQARDRLMTEREVAISAAWEKFQNDWRQLKKHYRQAHPWLFEESEAKNGPKTD